MSTPKQRHGCLTAWLILLMVSNGVGGLIIFVGKRLLEDRGLDYPMWAFGVLIGLSLVNVLCAIALWKWRKWGFWGYLASGLAAVALNVQVDTNFSGAISPLVGVLLLFFVLHIGGADKGWMQLD